MEGFCVVGGERLEGEAAVPSAKNAVLPMLAAAILPQGDVTLRQCPDIRDVRAMAGIPEKLGCRCEMRAGDMRIHNQDLQNWEMPEELSRQIRSSIFLPGAILAKLRRATVSYPGGREIGLRPIDLHLKGLRVLGVKIVGEGGRLYCDGRGMHAGRVYFDYPSVSTTENVMMASALLPGTTVIHNAARVRARDLRGGAALVLAALCAQGETVVEHAGLIDRGYPRLEAALAGLGARIRRISIPQQAEEQNVTAIAP